MTVNEQSLIRVVIGISCAMFLVLVLNTVFTIWERQQSQHIWCTTIETLNAADKVAEKAPASQKPHGAYSFALIRDFQQLQSQLGC